MLDPAASLALAEQVAQAAKQLGFDTALIGAAALAVHRYTRGTDNPGRIVDTPAGAAIARAQPLPGSSLRCVTIEDLVALKLYAGGLADHADIVQVLARNPEVDLAAVRDVAAPFDAGDHLEALIEQAASLGPRRR